MNSSSSAGFSRIRFDGLLARASLSSAVQRYPRVEAAIGVSGAARQCVAFLVAMQVIEIFLPLQRNDGSPQPDGLFAKIRTELVESFGGLTAYTRAPAEGLWEPRGRSVQRDLVIVVEVTVEHADRAWWTNFRTRLEQLFDQQSVLIRASAVELL